MPAAPVPADDDARTAALRRYRILDTDDAAGDLEVLVRLASSVTGAPLVQINVLDADRQVTVAGFVPDTAEISRDDAMCGWTVAEGRTVHAPDASQDPRFADNRFVTPPDGQGIRLWASAPVRDADGFVVGSVCVGDLTARELTDDELSGLEDLATQVRSLLHLRRQSADLQDALVALDHLAHVDPLTALANRRTMDATLGRAVASDGAGATVLFVDLDGFKTVNDRWGHDAGDRVLSAVAARVRSAVRPGDLVSRLGGDEFVVVAGPMTADAVTALVHRLRDSVEQPLRLADGTLVSVRVSIGVSDARPGEQAAHVMQRADGSMYRDKRERRRAVATTA